MHGFIEELKALDDGTQRILDNEDDEREGSSEKEPESRVLRVRKERVTDVVYSYAFTTDSPQRQFDFVRVLLYRIRGIGNLK